MLLYVLKRIVKKITDAFLATYQCLCQTTYLY